MSKECLVSVLCTAFNHEKYIRQTLQSFVDQQTDFPFEVLVNDDCSTDGTAAIIREFEAKYPEIVRAFYQEKNLYSQGINIEDTVMLPVAAGKYIAFCEGDDYWSDPSKLQRQTDFMESHPEYSACVHDSCVHFCDNSAEDYLYAKKHCPTEGDRDVELEEILQGMSHAYHTSSLFFRREFAFDLPDYFYCGAKHGFADFPRAIFLSLSGKIRFLDRPMSVYRVCSNPQSWSANVDSRYDKLHTFVSGQIEMLNVLLGHVSGTEEEMVRREIVKREFELFYIEGRDRELRKPPYRELLKQKPLGFRVKNFVKIYFRGVNSVYRRLKHYDNG